MKSTRDGILSDLLHECWERMAAGESLAACLQHYPEYAAELAPLLTTLVGLEQHQPVPRRRQRLATERRAQFIAAARQLSVAPGHPFSALEAWWQAALGRLGGPHMMPAGLLGILVLILACGVLATGAINASARALPGDILYPVKTAAENALVLLTRDPEARAALVEQIESQHVEDARTVQATPRPVSNIQIHGIVEMLSASQWRVHGLEITITPTTRIVGDPWVGAWVRAVLTAPGDGTLVALEIVVDPVQPQYDQPTPTPTGRPGGFAATPAPRYASPVPTATPRLAPVSTATRTTLTPQRTPAPTTGATPTVGGSTASVTPAAWTTYTPTPPPTATGGYSLTPTPGETSTPAATAASSATPQPGQTLTPTGGPTEGVSTGTPLPGASSTPSPTPLSGGMPTPTTGAEPGGTLTPAATATTEPIPTRTPTPETTAVPTPPAPSATPVAPSATPELPSATPEPPTATSAPPTATVAPSTPAPTEAPPAPTGTSLPTGTPQPPVSPTPVDTPPARPPTPVPSPTTAAAGRSRPVAC